MMEQTLVLPPHVAGVKLPCRRRPTFRSGVFLEANPMRTRSFFARLLAVAALVAAGLVPVQYAGAFQENAETKNSTRKIRVQPDEIAQRSGSGIHWETDWEVAQGKSVASGKPVFWYVPTIQGSFMDRKPEIDRYMQAGPFSWPAIINLINSRYIPLQMVPDADQARTFGLLAYEFVEPGFVVLTAENQQLAKTVDRLSTLHPHWIYSLLANQVGETESFSGMSGEQGREGLDALWQTVVASDWVEAIPADFVAAPGTEMELELLRGMQQFRNGNQDGAKETWKLASRQYLDSPLAWKAAMEAQGTGPFVRGFEVFGTLNGKAIRAGIDSRGSAAPEGTFSEEELWQRSVRFLLGMQSTSGGFFDSDYDFGGHDSLPNVHAAVTALAGIALIRAWERFPEGDLRTRTGRAIDRAADFCRDDSRLNRSDRDEILWAEAYRLRFLCEANRRAAGDPYAADIARVVQRLENLQMDNGTWYHEYPNSFVTATALISLRDAASSNVAVDQAKVAAGLSRLARQRFSSGAYPYATRDESAEGPRRVEPVPASAGRIPLCELARYLWDAVDQDQLAGAATVGMEHHELLARALKYDNHTNTYAYGGFFFWYDMQARSEAIFHVADSGQRRALARRQHDLIMNLPELDGCFIDSHELGRSYGTAMALISLSLLDDALQSGGTGE